MEIQARTDLSAEDHIRCYLMLAGTQRIYAMDELHEVAGMQNAAVRAEIARSVLHETARQEHAREVLGQACHAGFKASGRVQAGSGET